MGCRGLLQLGSSTGLVTVGPTKVKACKFIHFTEGIPEVEISQDVLLVIVYSKY